MPFVPFNAINSIIHGTLGGRQHVKSEAQTSKILLVAILRGVAPGRVVEIGCVLYDAGIRTIEVPLNSPDPFTSIAALAACGRADWTIGAGTVLTADDIRRTKQAGGRLAVMPNCDGDVIRCGLQLDLQVLPGIATPT